MTSNVCCRVRRCVVTQSSYTGDEDFALADAVFDQIGDSGDERFSLHDLTTPGVHAAVPGTRGCRRDGGCCGLWFACVNACKYPYHEQGRASILKSCTHTAGSFWVNAPYPVDKDGNRTAESAVDVQDESATLSR